MVRLFSNSKYTDNVLVYGKCAGVPLEPGERTVPTCCHNNLQ
jgi:hypothetical protein